MRRSAIVLGALLLSACGSIEYRDTNAAVDARPQCVGMDDDAPGAPVPDWCKREQAATWRVGDDEVPAPEFGDDDD